MKNYIVLALSLVVVACGNGKDVAGTDGSAYFGKWQFSYGGETVVLDIGSGLTKVKKTCANGTTVKGDLKTKFEGSSLVALMSLDQSMTVNGYVCKLTYKQGETVKLALSQDKNRLTITDGEGKEGIFVRIDDQGNAVVVNNPQPQPQPLPQPQPQPTPVPNMPNNYAGTWVGTMNVGPGFNIGMTMIIGQNTLVATSACNFNGATATASVTSTISVTGSVLTMLETKNQSVPFGDGYNCTSSSQAGQTATLELLSGGTQLKVSAGGQAFTFTRQ